MNAEDWFWLCAFALGATKETAAEKLRKFQASSQARAHVRPCWCCGTPTVNETCSGCRPQRSEIGLASLARVLNNAALERLGG